LSSVGLVALYNTSFVVYTLLDKRYTILAFLSIRY
jgi:hypothetical protein